MLAPLNGWTKALEAEVGLVIHLQFKSTDSCLPGALITTYPNLWHQKTTFQGKERSEPSLLTGRQAFPLTLSLREAEKSHWQNLHRQAGSEGASPLNTSSWGTPRETPLAGGSQLAFTSPGETEDLSRQEDSPLSIKSHLLFDSTSLPQSSIHMKQNCRAGQEWEQNCNSNAFLHFAK